MYDFYLINHYTIKLAPAANHKEIMDKLSKGEQLAPGDLADLSKVKAKLEIVGDYEDMEKFRALLEKLSGRQV